MLFNSYSFLLVFLPLTLVGYFAVGRRLGHAAAIVWLGVCSVAFYGWWDWRYVFLLLASVAFNALCGQYIVAQAGRNDVRKARLWLAVGVSANLSLLAYFKYAGFFLASVASLSGWHLPAIEIVLPLGISFFTFTQIAYLVDAYRGEVDSFSYQRYFLFVTYFPHLIAGPVLHHREMMPQFADRTILTPRAENFAIGLSVFAIGLFKKTVLADGIAPYGSSVFGAASGGASPTLFFAWQGALAYTCQLYFDFSGYSDMAVGLSLLFGIRLPINFNSPYKAESIIEFWRRWHITLSRFLRDYLYVPLGGNRKGRLRRYENLLTTMLLGGLWHGAAWTFVAWGALHGTYLVANHAWRGVMERLGWNRWSSKPAYRAACWLLTFIAVVVAWVFFRADSFGAAGRILAGMAGMNGISLPAAVSSVFGPIANQLADLGVQFELGHGREFVVGYAWVAALVAIALLLPNAQELLSHFPPALHPSRNHPSWLAFQWRPSRGWAFVMALLGAAGIASLVQHSEFLYYQF